MSDSSDLSVRRVHEVALDHPPALVHPEWAEAFPWLVQGTTTRGGSHGPFDLGLFSGGAPRDRVLASWRALVEATGCRAAAHARQVHGADVCVWDADRDTGRGTPDGEGPHPTLAPDADGHVTDREGLLLAVTVADCVPVFVIDPVGRAVGTIHGGWRGVAARVLERGLEAMAAAFGSAASDLHVHLGPAICGACYEVGPEVFEALGERAPEAPAPIDLRAVLARRAVRAGVGVDRLTISTHCTRCTGSELFSHRGGDPHRQVGYIGLVPGSA